MDTVEYDFSRIVDIKCVGERDICSNPKYFMFYCNPKVKFVFRCKDNFVVRLFRFQSKSSRNFLKIQFAINSVGWSTFDLS